MIREILIRPEAEQDVSAARDWYHEKREVLGREFLDEFARAMDRLKDNPEREHLYYGNFRRVIMERFPYKIFYQSLDDRIVVFRVLHAKQDHRRRIAEDL
jgi:plasmid stabilization system protein ParE